jgi:hypothetical protein
MPDAAPAAERAALVEIDADAAVAALTAAAFTTGKIADDDPRLDVLAQHLNDGERDDPEVRKALTQLLTELDAVTNGPPRTLIATTTPGPLHLNADWDLDAAIAFMREADQIAWVRSATGHNLAALLLTPAGREGAQLRYFQVPLPDDMDARLTTIPTL